MTEQEWLACADPDTLLRALRRPWNNRKLRLFACACCRRIWHLLTDKRSRQAVETIELYVDGQASSDQMSAAEIEADEAYRSCRHRVWASFVGEVLARQAVGDERLDAFTDSATAQMAKKAEMEDVQTYAAHTICFATSSDEQRNLGFSFGDNAMCSALGGQQTLALLDSHSNEKSVQCELLRDIFGNPFRLVTFHPAWLSSTVTNLAETIYTDRAFDKMPVLGDALEDVGCDNQDILKHCRSGEHHCKGCWVVDKVLGKE